MPAKNSTVRITIVPMIHFFIRLSSIAEIKYSISTANPPTKYIVQWLNPLNNSSISTYTAPPTVKTDPNSSVFFMKSLPR